MPALPLPGLPDVLSMPALADYLALGASDVDLTWQQSASCAQADPEAWFPEKGNPDPVSVRQAKAVCGACPVRTDCLDYALTNDERYGIWGGLTETQRRRLRRAQPDTDTEVEADVEQAA